MPSMPLRRLMFLLVASAAAVAQSGAQEISLLSTAISPKTAEVWAGHQSELPLAPAVIGGSPELIPEGASLDAGGFALEQPCTSCNGGGGGAGGNFYNRCGCSAQHFPWFEGPGDCDNWCVGPHWNVEADGLFMRRESADWGSVIGNVGLTPELVDQFDFGPGGRIFVTGYNDSSFGMQVGYEGINDFHATALFPGVASERTFNYQSTLNSLEFNLIRRTDVPLKVFAGFRYVEVDEDFIDSTIVDKTPPAPSTPPTVAPFVDLSDAFLVENRLFGFQAGGFRDAWQLNRWITIEPFGNAGVYFNSFKREAFNGATTTTFISDDPLTPDDETDVQVTSTGVGVRRDFSEIAFLGEAGVSGIVRLNRCVALRGGYQVMAIDGVGEGLDAFFNPGLEPTTLVYHGFRFGIEYQR